MSFKDEIGDVEADALEEVSRLRTINTRLGRKLRATKLKNKDLIDAVYQATYDAAETAASRPKIIPPKFENQSKGGKETALVHVTDWQYGKKTNTYNAKVCEKRIQTMVAKVCQLTDIQRNDHPVDDLHLLLGGDMVEGVTIFPGQAWELDITLFDQFQGVAKLIEEMVEAFLSHFKHVHVWEEAGNHGRIGLPGTTAAGDNIDRMAYFAALSRIRSDHLTWHPISTEWHQIVTIGNYRAMLAHGDEVRSFGGITKKALEWTSGVVEPFKDIYLGHFHTPTTITMPNAGRIFVTGTTESDSDYAKKVVAATNVPSQRLHFIDPRKGRVTSEHTLWLD